MKSFTRIWKWLNRHVVSFQIGDQQQSELTVPMIPGQQPFVGWTMFIFLLMFWVIIFLSSSRYFSQHHSSGGSFSRPQVHSQSSPRSSSERQVLWSSFYQHIIWRWCWPWWEENHYFLYRFYLYCILSQNLIFSVFFFHSSLWSLSFCPIWGSPGGFQ